mgnify:CR=1 FL=1
MQIHFWQTLTRFKCFLSYSPPLLKCDFRKKSVNFVKKVWFLSFFVNFLSFFVIFSCFFGFFLLFFWLKWLKVAFVFPVSFWKNFGVFSIFGDFWNFWKKRVIFLGQFFLGFLKFSSWFPVDSKKDSFGAPKSGVLHKVTTLGRSPRLTNIRINNTYI